ncbi:MAG TPA: hypothetical protein VG244_10870 [Acidimicrobiales bacterium]|nr:hypothetical protein [Acidimicrobiales bacterium]
MAKRSSHWTSSLKGTLVYAARSPVIFAIFTMFDFPAPSTLERRRQASIFLDTLNMIPYLLRIFRSSN